MLGYFTFLFSALLLEFITLSQVEADCCVHAEHITVGVCKMAKSFVGDSYAHVCHRKRAMNYIASKSSICLTGAELVVRYPARCVVFHTLSTSDCSSAPWHTKGCRMGINSELMETLVFWFDFGDCQ